MSSRGVCLPATGAMHTKRTPHSNDTATNNHSSISIDTSATNLELASSAASPTETGAGGNTGNTALLTDEHRTRMTAASWHSITRVSSSRCPTPPSSCSWTSGCTPGGRSRGAGAWGASPPKTAPSRPRHRSRATSAWEAIACWPSAWLRTGACLPFFFQRSAPGVLTPGRSSHKRSLLLRSSQARE